MPKIYSKSQNAKLKWDGAEDPTINHFYKIGNIKF